MIAFLQYLEPMLVPEYRARVVPALTRAKAKVKGQAEAKKKLEKKYRDLGAHKAHGPTWLGPKRPRTSRRHCRRRVRLGADPARPSNGDQPPQVGRIGALYVQGKGLARVSYMSFGDIRCALMQPVRGLRCCARVAAARPCVFQCFGIPRRQRVTSFGQSSAGSSFIGNRKRAGCRHLLRARPTCR